MLLPDELGEELLGELLLAPPLELLPELELPMPLLLLPEELGDELLLGELLLGELLLDVPPLDELLLPDLLKNASHSEREMEPSLFLSTAENDGVELLELAPLEALGEDDEEELGEAALGEDEELLGEDELLEAPPEALPEDLLLSVALGLDVLGLDVLGLELLGLELLGLELEEPLVLCAAATPARARSAAAVAETTTFTTMWIPPRRLGKTKTAAGRNAITMPATGMRARDFFHMRASCN